MLRAKTEVPTTPDISRSTSSVPTIEISPISSGIAAATTPRKTNSSSSARTGKAISSALVRSVRVWSLVSLKPAAKPPWATSSELEAITSPASSAAIPPASSMSVVER